MAKPIVVVMGAPVQQTRNPHRGNGFGRNVLQCVQDNEGVCLSRT